MHPSQRALIHRHRKVLTAALGLLLLVAGVASARHLFLHMCDWGRKSIGTVEELARLGHIKLPESKLQVEGIYRRSACHGSVAVAMVRARLEQLKEFRRANGFTDQPTTDPTAMHDLLGSAPVELTQRYHVNPQRGWVAEVRGGRGYFADLGAGDGITLYVFVMY